MATGAAPCRVRSRHRLPIVSGRNQWDVGRRPSKSAPGLVCNPFFCQRRGFHLRVRQLPLDHRKNSHHTRWVRRDNRHATTPSGAGVSRAAPAQVAFNAVGDGNPSLPNSAAFNALRLTLVAVICLAAYFVLRDWGRPPLSSSYGRSYWLIAFLALLLRELPFAVAIIRTWKAPDRAGLALAMIAGVTDLLYFWDPSARSPWLTTCPGLAAVVLACLVWRPSLSRKGDVGLIISIFFGLAAYTVLTRIAVLILASRLRA
jgi:hypothetical protein